MAIFPLAFENIGTQFGIHYSGKSLIAENGVPGSLDNRDQLENCALYRGNAECAVDSAGPQRDAEGDENLFENRAANLLHGPDQSDSGRHCAAGEGTGTDEPKLGSVIGVGLHKTKWRTGEMPDSLKIRFCASKIENQFLVFFPF